MSGLVVRAFGDFKKPKYAGTVDRFATRSMANGWCCGIGGGHKTPRAAALHAAEIALDEWRSDKKQFSKPEQTS